MNRHTIDPVSFVLGIAAVIVGVLVAAGRADAVVDNPVWLIAIVAIAIGMALLDLAIRAGRNRSQL